MKRDLELCRLILLAVEARPSNGVWNLQIEIEGHEYAQVVYNAQLLADEGYVIVRDWSCLDQDDIRIERLTAAGHDFLDNARDESRWSEAKRSLGSLFKTTTLSTLSTVLERLALKTLGLE